MHKAWSSIEEVPYCFSRSSVKFQGHIALKIVEFDPNWAFPDCNSSLNSPMAMKCCTKLETAKKRCHIVFQGHPSNFKVTRDKTSTILTQIGRFRTIGRSQLSNPSDLPCWTWNIYFNWRIVVFLHISIILPRISKGQICYNTPMFSVAAIFVKYCYTTGSLVSQLMSQYTLFRLLTTRGKSLWNRTIMVIVAMIYMVIKLIRAIENQNGWNVTLVPMLVGRYHYHQ